MSILFVSLFLIFAPLIQAPPAAAAAPAFEVAAIHPAKQDENHSLDSNQGRCLIHNFTLKRLIAAAYEIDSGLISGGPKWGESQSFDINAKIPAEFSSSKRDLVPAMLQSLLADRFKLVTHLQAIQVSGYELVTARNGPKMERSESGAPKARA